MLIDEPILGAMQRVGVIILGVSLAIFTDSTELRCEELAVLRRTSHVIIGGESVVSISKMAHS